jgi:pimeloyl-ACP methyl ester carboxylesterase
MARFVIVHGAWHTGAEFEATAAPMRAAGHDVHLPTLAGNRAGEPKDIGLEAAIASLVDYLDAEALDDFVLVGHSYGGMIITAVADRLPTRVRRLVYWNAFVPLDGEALTDLVPPQYAQLFEALRAADGGTMMPFPIWREAFMNDASLAEAESAYARLNPHPWRDAERAPAPGSPSGRTADGQIVSQRHRGHCPAPQPRLASAPVGAAGAVSPGAMRRRP